MTRKTLICLATALTAASIQLSGCGRTPTQPQAPPISQAVTPPNANLLADQAGDELRQQHQAMMAALNLTGEQKGQLQAIKARYKDPAGKQAMKQKLELLGNQITAETVDQTAVEQTFDDLIASFRAKVPRIVTMAGEVRDVLTAEQRQQAITLITEKKEDFKTAMDRLREKGFTAISANLNLTAEQNAALLELKQLDETSDEAKFDTLSAAFATFLGNGNQESLRASFEGVITDENVDKTVDWIASLDQTQRQQLLTNMKAYMKQIKEMHKAMRADMGMPDTDDD